MPTNVLACDGCGQSASPEHIARRLRRLEWTTRYRPVHIGTLLLAGVSPQADEDFLYAAQFNGEAGRLLDAVGISTTGKSAEVVLSEFQRRGLLLTHLLECPFETGQWEQQPLQDLFRKRLPQVVTRIRRSLKPKRVVLISEALAPLAARFSEVDLGCPLILDDGKPFGLDSADAFSAVHRLRQGLGMAAAGM